MKSALRAGALPSLGVLGAVLGLVLAAFGSRTAHAGDPDLAKFLLQGGKDALAKKQYDEAVKKFDRALEEDPSLLEAAYLAGVVFDTKKESAVAVARYRTFRELCKAKQEEGKASKEELALLAKAETRINEMAAGEEEFRRLQDSYVAQLLTLARDSYIRDPTLATKALKRVLDVRPGEADATALLEKLGGSTPAVPGSDASGKAPGALYQDVASWDEFLSDPYFRENSGVRFDGKVLTIDSLGGDIYTPREHAVSGSRFVYEIELRFTDVHPGERAAGIGFATEPGVGGMVLILTQSRLVLASTRNNAMEEIRSTGLGDVAMKEWRRLTLVADGGHLQGFVDGKLQLDAQIDGRDSFEGRVSVFAQFSRVEIRTLRVGKRS